MSDRVWITTHMMIDPQSQVAAVSAYASPGRTGILNQLIFLYNRTYQLFEDKLKNICCKYGIQTCFKGNTAIKQVLMKSKDQDPKERKSWVIYSFQCNHIACNEEYIGETARTLGERWKEHLKQPSPIHTHIQQTGHNTTKSSFIIIGREDQGLDRTIKESIYIRINNPTLTLSPVLCI